MKAGDFKLTTHQKDLVDEVRNAIHHSLENLRGHGSVIKRTSIQEYIIKYGLTSVCAHLASHLNFFCPPGYNEDLLSKLNNIDLNDSQELTLARDVVLCSLVVNPNPGCLWVVEGLNAYIRLYKPSPNVLALQTNRILKRL